MMMRAEKGILIFLHDTADGIRRHGHITFGWTRLAFV